jgi:hypothetical protein
MIPDWEAKPTSVPYASFGNPQSLNLYSYVNNNPTTVRDPDGHCIWDGCIAEATVTAMAILYLASPPGQQMLGRAATDVWNTPQNLGHWIGNHFLSSDNSKSEPAPHSNPTPGTQSGGADATRHQALNDAKRDADVPTSQQPNPQTRVPVTDQSGRQVIGADGKPQTSREYTHTTGGGEKVVIQDHSQGHTYPDGATVGPHINVRPQADTRHGEVPGTKKHYPYKKKDDSQ